MKLYNFTGTCVSDLREAIKAKEGLSTSASLLKLSVGRHNEDLDDLQDLVDDASGNFDFPTLFERYSISYGNPISVDGK